MNRPPNLFQLKIDPPDKFNGKGDFDYFYMRFKNYMMLSDQDYGPIMKFAEEAQSPVTRDEQDAMDVSHAGETRRLSTLLYYVLSGLVTDSAYTLIYQVADSNGMEAWRLLTNRYAKTNQQTAITTLVSIVNTKFEDRTFETTFAKWESQVTMFERAIKKELYDEIKVGLLVAGTSGKLHDHLCLTTTDNQSYSEVRGVILNYLKTKQLTSLTKNTKPDYFDDPMQVDAFGYYKGKGRGKGDYYKGTDYKGGKAKGKGKDYKGADSSGGTKGKGKGEEGKGKGEDYGKFCHYCWSDTHHAKNCWWYHYPWQGHVWEDDKTTPEVAEPAVPAVQEEVLQQAAVYHQAVVGDNYPEDLEINYVGAVKCSPPEQTSDYVMIDSGAQVCVCGKDYAPECKILECRDGLPNLRTVNGNTINVCGVKFVNYRINKYKWMMVKYYVGDGIEEPVIGTSSLGDADYSTVLDKHPRLLYRGQRVCDLVYYRRLNYMHAYERRPVPTTEKGAFTNIAPQKTLKDYYSLKDDYSRQRNAIHVRGCNLAEKNYRWNYHWKSHY